MNKKCLCHLLTSAVVTIGELGRKWHVELIIWDMTEATAWRRWLFKSGKEQKHIVSES